MHLIDRPSFVLRLCKQTAYTWRVRFRYSLTATGFCLLSGIAHAQPLWHRYDLASMQLVTDLPVAQARTLLQTLVWFDRVVSEFVPRSADVQAPPLEVLVFASRREFNRVVAQRHFAAYTLPGIAATTLVVGPDQSGDTTTNALHEYTHYRLRTQPIAYPMWYEEGIASLLSTTEFTVRDDRLVVTTGHKLPDELQNLAGPVPRLSTVVDATTMDAWSPAETARFYQRATKLVQYFLFAPAAGFKDYRVPLANYFADRSGKLLAALALDSRTLAGELRSFRSTRDTEFGAFAYDIAAFPTPDAAVRDVDQTELDHLFAQTAEMPNPAFARRLYRKLAAQHPGDPRYRVGLSRALMERDPSRAAHALDEAARLQATHPEVLVQRAALTTQGCPMDATFSCIDQWRAASALLREALEQDPDQFDAILRLGIIELYAGDPGTALSYLRIAHHRAPWSARVNFHLGECLRLLGNPRAAAHLEQARNWAQSEGLRRLAALALELENEQR